ncbi:MAG: hypothetical protein JJU06_07905 [Ectothiorhodospiraceae bacterium]|nr:hypothetical protein [Ectothiorhodospiraceae bacterium]
MSRLRYLASALLALCLAGPGSALAEPGFFSKQGFAIGGTDPVAYFTAGRPMQGSPDYAVEWQDATWLFASAEHRDLFREAPEAYAPQYGGWCAWAVAQGYTAPTTPEAWKIVDGRLYLNYSQGVQRRWERDIPGFIETADANWPELME